MTPSMMLAIADGLVADAAKLEQAAIRLRNRAESLMLHLRNRAQDDPGGPEATLLRHRRIQAQTAAHQLPKVKWAPADAAAVQRQGPMISPPMTTLEDKEKFEAGVDAAFPKARVKEVEFSPILERRLGAVVDKKA